MFKIVLLFIFSLSTLIANPIPDKVSVQLLWKHQFEFAGFYMAKEKGFYDDVNLDVDIKEFQRGTNITKDVENGISTFGVGYPKIILDKLNGADIVVLNAILQSSPHILVSLANSKIDTLQDFRNKKVMMEKNTVENASFLSMFFSKKIDLDTIDFVTPSFNIYDLINKKVDIASSYRSNELFTLDSLGIKYNVFDPKEYGFDFYNDLLFTSKKLATNNPELVSRFQTATIKGWKYAYANIHETIQLIQQKYNPHKKSYDALVYEAQVLKKLSLQKEIPFGDIQLHKLERIKDVYGLMGLIQNDANLDNFIFDYSKIDLSEKEKEFIANTPLTISISKAFKPISFQDENKSPSGIATEYWEILAKELGLNITYKFDAVFTEQLNSIKEKTADVIFSTGKTADREKYALFTDNYINFPISIATKSNENFIENFSKVIHKKIAVGKNYTAHKLLIKQYPNINFVFVDSIQKGLELVNKGEVFGFVEMNPILSYNIKKLEFENIKIAGNTGATFKLSIMIRDDYPLLQSALNKAITSVDKSHLDTIIKSYENIKFEKSYDYETFFIIVGIFICILIFSILKHYYLNQSNKKLQALVEKKTKSLQELNDTLEIRIKEAIDENSRKDSILYQQAKNAQMGEMIGNIAHQWRQPLSLISTASSGILAQKKFGLLTDEKEEEALNAIIEKVHFLSGTIDTFRDYIKEKKEFQEVNLQERINKDINIIEASLSNNYILLCNEINKCEPIRISLLAGELSQVIINILNNAKDALVEKEVASPMITVSLVKEKQKVIISIEDNAGGIKENIISKIFNPYFTTKHQSIGTGLGLYMSKEIVEKHLKGKLTVKNTNVGAKFSIELPLLN